MSTIVEITANLQIALKEAGEAEKKYSDALAGIKPLEAAAIEKRNAVSLLMNQYQELTQPASEETPIARKRRGSSGAKRAPRQFLPIAMTTSSRLMKTAKTEGKTKKIALQAAMDRVTEIAKKRGEDLTDEIRTQIEKRASEIYTK